MHRIYTTPLSVSQCVNKIRDNTDFISLAYGMDKFTGWIKWRYFRICYHKGEENRYLVGIKRIKGRVYAKDGKTFVKVKLINGLADLYTYSIYTLFISLILYLSTGAFLLSAVFALVMSAIATIVSVIIAHASLGAYEREAELIKFITELLKLEEFKI